MQTILSRHWHHLPDEEVLDLLESDRDSGLDFFEVDERQGRFGPNEIAEKEGIGVSEEEVSQRVYMMAMQQRRPVKKVARELRDNNAFGEVRQDILISKTIEFLRENAVVTEVDPPEEDA